ncbi:hypothetical protein F8R89_00765 [Streptomyces sp. SS1-1]|uniref:hypothetical protein n=1 Tax=Streptomyces sp. SS1-1 TaxID=2651869 RepID=UPI00124FE37C|nr:hypothetical protein [Streptomyces sp. SS1-1]KAB2977613.1 hypothetical protein F8R89_00765 [Streptomyces sp. SS1-1]
MASNVDNTPIVPTTFAELRTETYEDHDEPWQWNWQPGTERTVISTDAATGASTYLLRFPPGYDRGMRHRPDGVAEQFEWHNVHEEVFCVEGRLTFGEWFELPSPGYLNHPPRWLHPANQYSDEGCVLLIKNSSPFDFCYTDVPQDWNGVEHLVDRDPDQPAAPGDLPAVTALAVNDLPRRPVRTRAGKDTGLTAAAVYHNPVSGWTTWTAEVPAGWTGAAFDGGTDAESAFVLDGEIDLDGRRIGKWGYGSAEHGLLTSPSAASPTGATVLCWTRSLGSVVTGLTEDPVDRLTNGQGGHTPAADTPR